MVTYKIDRTSNNSLQLGLRNSVILTSGKNSDGTFRLSVNSPIYTSQDDKITENGQLTTKTYVDKTAVEAARTLLSTWIQGSDIISVLPVKDGNNVTSGATISLAAQYTDVDSTTKLKTFSVSQEVVDTITVNKYGILTGVTFKKLSSADLDNTSNSFDNYRSWMVGVGTEYAPVVSSYGSDGKNDSATTPSTYALNFTAGNGINVTLTKGNSSVLSFSLVLNSAGAIAASTTGLDLKTTMTADHTDGLYSISADKYGRITAMSDFDLAKLVAKFKYFIGSEGVLVPANSADNQSNPENNLPDSSERYLNGKGKWEKIPYSDVSVQPTSAGTEYYLLGTPATAASVETAAYFDENKNLKYSNGNLYSTYFVGNGSLLTNIAAPSISPIGGTLSDSVMPDWAVSLKAFGNSISGFSKNSVLYASNDGVLSSVMETGGTTTANYVLAKKNVTSNTADFAPNWVDISTIISGQITESLASALIFKGFLDSTVETETNTTKKDLPTTGFKVGNMYKVSHAGKYGYGTITCEVDDAIYCIKDDDGSYTAANVSDYWGAIQSNIVNAITFDSSVTVNGTTNVAYVIPVKSIGTNTLMDSTITFSNGILDANASSANKLSTSRNLWGKAFNGTADVSGDLASVGNISTDSTDLYNIGASDHRFLNVFAKTINGDLIGTADAAKKVQHSLTITNIDGSSKSFDGSSDLPININYSEYKVLTSSTGTIMSSEVPAGMNVLSNITAAIDQTSGSLTLTPSYVRALTSLTSDLFSIGQNTASPKIEYLSSYSSTSLPVFYVGTVPGDEVSDRNLNLAGNLTAYSVKVRSDHGTEGANFNKVAQTQSGTAQTEDSVPILRSYTLSSNSSLYEFIKSGFFIRTASGMTAGLASATWDSDSNVPTAAAVSAYVKASVQNTAKGVTKTMKLKFSEASSVATASTVLPVGTLIKDVMIVCTSQVTGTSPSVSVDAGANLKLVGADENDLSSANVYEYKLCETMPDQAAPSITLYDSGATATMVSSDFNSFSVLIDYIEPDNYVL